MEESGSNKACVVMVEGWMWSVAVENLHGGGFAVAIVMACYRDSYIEIVVLRKTLTKELVHGHRLRTTAA